VQIKIRRQWLETAIRDCGLQLFPVDARNFADWGRLSLKKNGGGAHTEETMNGLIYLVGLVVVILAVLSFFGLR
jgi:hypothetical protein